MLSSMKSSRRATTLPTNESNHTPRTRQGRMVTIAMAAVVMAVVAGCGTTNTNANNAASGSPQTTPSTNTTNNATSSSSNLSPSLPSSTKAAKTKAPVLAANAVLATYTGGKVTKAQFDTEYATISFLEPYMSPGTTTPTKAQFLPQYAAYYRYMLTQAEKNAAITKQANSMVNQGFSQFISALGSQFKTKAAFSSKLKSLGISENDIKSYMYQDEVLNGYVQKAMGTPTVTTAQVNAYIKQHQAQYTQVDVRHILVKTLKTADMIETKLKNGGNFASLAKKYSIDPGSKNKGGNLGTAVASSYVTPFANACLTLPLNTISKPVHSQFGYHIIEVLKRTVLTSQAKSDMITTKKNTLANALLQKVKKESNVKILVKSNQSL